MNKESGDSERDRALLGAKEDGGGGGGAEETYACMYTYTHTARARQRARAPASERASRLLVADDGSTASSGGVHGAQPSSHATGRNPTRVSVRVHLLYRGWGSGFRGLERNSCMTSQLPSTEKVTENRERFKCVKSGGGGIASRYCCAVRGGESLHPLPHELSQKANTLAQRHSHITVAKSQHVSVTHISLSQKAEPPTPLTYH